MVGLQRDGSTCCEDAKDLTPASVANPPGMAALAYRTGTQATFKATMKAHLSRQPALAALTTRDDDDSTIALLDAWATVLDVLTFYQERIANEGFLPTATEDRSVRELARTIGYELAPGVAAGATLAFELETAPGAPGEAIIPAGAKVQSLPGQDELPQVFETVQEMRARGAWNSLRARTVTAGTPAIGTRELYVQGVATGLRPGDCLLVLGRERQTDPASDEWDVRTLISVRTDAQRDHTRVRWTEPLTISPGDDDPIVLAFRSRAALFGHNAPDWRAMPAAVQTAYAGSTTPAPADWPTLSISRVGTGGTANAAGTIYLDSLYPQIVAGSWVLLSAAGISEPYLVQSSTADSRTDFTLSSKSTHLQLSGPSLTAFDTSVRQLVVLGQSEPLDIAPVPVTDPVQGAQIDLECPAPTLAEGHLLVVSGRRAHVTAASGPLKLSPDGGLTFLEIPEGEVLEVVAPFTESTSGLRTWKLRRTNGRVGTVEVPAAALVSCPAPVGETMAEQATAGAPASDAPEQSTVKLNGDLRNCYDPATVRIAANVVMANHGESKGEVLGSGDAARPFQRFTLKQSPLTYVRDGLAPGGAASTLRVEIGGVLWPERRSLLDADGRAHAHVVRVIDDGTTAVTFGDGVHGARVPTGQENVVATYRVGTGLAGMVDAGQLSLLMTRPLGVKSVTNPFPAEGAEDPETGDRARRNAPNTVRTLERVVSLLDFENFAMAYAGVGKAAATWLWDGDTRLVHVTAAAADGQPLLATSATSQALVAALRSAGDQRVPLRVDPFEPKVFELEAAVVVDPTYQPGAVLSAAADAVRTAFSFDPRRFAQSVAASEVVVTIQRVPGVIAVDLVALHLSGEAVVPNAFLTALPARLEDGTVRAAQLLTIAADGVRLTWLT